MNFRESILAVFYDKYIIGAGVNQGLGFMSFSIETKYLFGNNDDILSFYGALNMDVGNFYPGNLSTNNAINYTLNNSLLYFGIEPAIGFLMLRKYNFQVFGELGYKIPVVKTEFNKIAGIDLSIGVNFFFKDLFYIY